MGFDRKRRGRARDKRDSFGDEGYDGYRETPSYESNSNSSRHPSFDRDDRGNNGPSSRPASGGMPAQVIGTGKGTVKFFNASKGFGFVACDDRPDDVFVHISAVEQAGLEGLGEGQELEFTLVDRGGKVSASDLVIVGDIVAAEAAAPKPSRDAPAGGQQRQLTGDSSTGTVKFFNAMKGFGFVARDDGESDVFVHISSLEKSGISTVNEGDRLKFDIEIDRRGKFSAVNLSTLQE